MIRIISLSLLTLMLSCANMRPEPADETSQKNAPAAEPAAKPGQEKMAPEIARKTHIPELKLTPEDNGHKNPAKPSARRNSSPKPAAKTPVVKTPALASDTKAVSATTSPAENAEAPKICIPSNPITTVSGNAPVQGISGNTQADATEVVSADAVSGATSTETDLTVIPAGDMSAAASSAAGASQFAPSTLETPILSADSKQEREKRFLPTRRRIDREINKIKFAYKGEVMMGLTASYGTLSSDDTDFMLILDNINASGTIATVKPFIGYFYRDNNCLGVRFGYNHVGGSIKSLNFDLGESNDISFEVPYVDLTSDNYSFGIFHRSYAGLDPKGRFGLFAEFELAVSTGSSAFTYETGGELKSTFSDNTQVKLSFNPGAAVYIFPNVCATLSFGLGGLQYTSVTQKDAEGNKIGSRKSSNMKFKLNIAAINIGMTIHLWDKKKQ